MKDNQSDFASSLAEISVAAQLAICIYAATGAAAVCARGVKEGGERDGGGGGGPRCKLTDKVPLGILLLLHA